jgi:ribonuclease D
MEAVHFGLSFLQDQSALRDVLTARNLPQDAECSMAADFSFSLEHWQNLPEEVVQTPPQLAACCAHLASCPQLGLDTEFIGEDTYHPRLCLVQIATPERLFLIDPLALGPLDALWSVLLDPSHQVIVHGGREEIRLCQLWGGQAPAALFDLQIAAGLVGFPYPLGHAALVQQLLGVRLRKGETLTEWRNRPLTREQIRYAFDDVRYLLPLWAQLRQRLVELDRLAWAEEEFTRLKELAVATLSGLGGEQNVDDPRWRKLRGLRTLSRQQLAIVRELYAWREAEAARANRPPRTILRDDLLVDIARRQPRRERDLYVVRGLPRHYLPALLEVVAHALALPAEAYPPAIEYEPEPPQLTILGYLLSSVFGDLCARLHLAPTLVASNQDLKQLLQAWLRQQAPPADSLLAQGWRAAHILPLLLEVLAGRCRVRVAAPHSATPLAYESQSA